MSMGIGRMIQNSGRCGEIIMSPPIKDPFNAGLFLPVRKQFSKRGSRSASAYSVENSFVRREIV